MVNGGDGRDNGLVWTARSLSVRCRRQDFPPQLFRGRLGDQSAVDDKFRTGDEARFVGREEWCKLCDFVSVACASHWSKVDQGVLGFAVRVKTACRSRRYPTEIGVS